MINIVNLSADDILKITPMESNELDRAACADRFHDAMYARDGALTKSLLTLFLTYNDTYAKSIITVQAEMADSLMDGELNDFAYLCDVLGRSSTQLLNLFGLRF